MNNDSLPPESKISGNRVSFTILVILLTILMCATTAVGIIIYTDSINRFKSREMAQGTDPKYTAIASFESNFTHDRGKNLQLVSEDSTLRVWRDPFSPLIEPATSSNVSNSRVSLLPPVRELTDQELGVFVTGIIRGQKGYQAVITTSEGNSYLITPGQKIGNWTVSSINDKTVVVKTKNYIASLELKLNVYPPGSKKFKEKKVAKTVNDVLVELKEGTGMKLTGILETTRGFEAVLTGTDGRSYLVTKGQKVGNWTVSFISEKTVFLATEDSLAILQLPTVKKFPDKEPSSPELPKQLIL